MSNNYSGNLRGWYDRSEVDWFAQFIQIWIPFNAWYRNSYPNLKNERDILDEIKKPNNPIYSGIIPLFRGRNNNAINFRHHISVLHERLSNHVIENRGKRCCFEEIDLGLNSIKNHSFSYKGVIYSGEYKHNSTDKVELKIISRNKTIQAINITEWRIDLFQNNQTIQSLPPNKVSYLQTCFQKIRPRIIESLLYEHPTSSGGLEFGAYRFRDDDDEKIFAGIIEIIYSLRNLLFHGHITPNTHNNEIYEPAYYIVRNMLEFVI